MSSSGRPVELSGSRKEMEELLLSSPDADEVIVKVKPSRRVFALILDATSAKTVRMSEGVAATVPSKVMKALKGSVRVVIEKKRRGRPRKWDEKKAKKVIGMRLSADEKAKRLGISRRSYFYLKKKLSR